MGIEKDIRAVNVAYYYPSTVSPSKEFKALAEVENPELKALWELAWKWYCNTFVYDIDVDGAERWESMLSITPAKGSTLTERKRAILAKINYSLPYTERSFQNMLNGVYGEGRVKLSVEYDRYAVWLDLVQALMYKNKEIRRYARVIVPANMGIYIRQTIKAIAEKIIIGGHIKTRNAIVVKPGDNFIGPHLPANEYRGGYVTLRKIMEV